MMDIKGKKITVIGAIRSGSGSAKLIKKLGGIPFVSDMADTDKVRESVQLLKELGIESEIGGHTDKALNCDLMVVSPGVPSNAEILKKAQDKNIKVIGEIELASSVCKGKIAAITGTNGKTTATSLCEHVFNNCGVKTYAAGNIGYAFSEIALEVSKDEFVALEISSFQIDLIDNFKPKIAVILNITPDHLNRYENKFENYIKSKLRIYKNQDENDFLILNKDDAVLNKWVKDKKSKPIYFSLKEEITDGCSLSGERVIYKEAGEVKFECNVKDINLNGEHNIANAMAVIASAKLMKLDNKKIIEALGTFKGVEHRLELVREIDGVKYINDSKATNVDSVWYALRSFDSPIFLILGGQDKGNDYNQIKDLITDRVKKIYAIGSSCDKIFNFFHSVVKVEVKGTLEEAVIAANNEAREGDVVLLSPACASFDMFDNYEHRGLVFKKAVKNL